MSPNIQAVTLTLHVDTGAGAHPDELDRATRQLRDEIRELNVESVELVKHSTIPKGAKSAEAATVGALAVTTVPIVLPKLIECIQNWVTRREGRTIKIKTQVGERSLEVEYSPTAMSQAELKGLVNTLMRAIEKQH